MRLISVEEISSYKILPFDLYNENEEIILRAGEEITPGKLLKLRYVSSLYADSTEELEEDVIEYQDVESEQDIIEESTDEDEIYLEEIQIKEPKRRKSQTKPKDPEKEKLAQEYEKKLEETKHKLDYEEGDDEPKSSIPFEHITYENELSCIPVKSQLSIKNDYKRAINTVLRDSAEDSKDIYLDVRDQIVEETLLTIDDLIYKSQLKVYGEYNYTHGINVAVLSTALAYKLKLNDSQIKDVALAAMLHDIGKLKIPKEIVEKQTLTSKESKLIQLHPQVGYRILKKEMRLSESIALVALEHHEKNDGSGYPYGISGEQISLYSQIVMICDVYDNLTSNRGLIKVKNSKEAIKTILDGGSKWFTPWILYTFVYMSNYNDTLPLAPH